MVTLDSRAGALTTLVERQPDLDELFPNLVHATPE